LKTIRALPGRYGGPMTERRPATQATVVANRAAAAAITFDDPTDASLATRGLIATIDGGRIIDDGRVVWDVNLHDFTRGDRPAPDTVHPGLWRQAGLNAHHGLFEVMPGVWQARGYDLSNITFIEGATGWVIIDVLTTAPTARACLALANRALGERPVRAVIYTHSHIDHFGGIHGVVDAEQVAAGEVRIIAPDGFMAEAINENVIAGPAMARRAMYQFGRSLPFDELGHVDSGLGKATPTAPSGLLAPTETVTGTGTRLEVDGIDVIFQNTPDAEAPAEMNFFFPTLGLLCMAENCTHTLHNVYPIRGAPTRDALAWSKYIGEALHMWGADTEVMISTHHWPRVGNGDVTAFLRLQRDLYRWIHDQTMRLANTGHTPNEIADLLVLPPCFSEQSHVQGYYGTVAHNAKSVYTRYLGWYDGNPAHLHPHPPTEAGRRYVEVAGGPDQLLTHAQAAFDEGDYRWVAELVNHLVFADPANTAARELQAAALEQLGYQSESATWRNAYLLGAQELRDGMGEIRSGQGRQLLSAMSPAQIFDAIGVRLDGAQLEGVAGTVNWVFTDLEAGDEHHVVGVENCTIHHVPGHLDPAAKVTLTLTRQALAGALGIPGAVRAAVEAGEITIDGDPALLITLFGAMTEMTPFTIVEP